MQSCQMPDTTPFQLQGLIFTSQTQEYLRATMTLNEKSFAGFPPDFLYLKNLSGSRSGDPNFYSVIATFAESVNLMQAEKNIGVPVWDRTDFGRLFEGFWAPVDCEDCPGV